MAIPCNIMMASQHYRTPSRVRLSWFTGQNVRACSYDLVYVTFSDQLYYDNVDHACEACGAKSVNLGLLSSAGCYCLQNN